MGGISGKQGAGLGRFNAGNYVSDGARDGSQAEQENAIVCTDFFRPD